MRRAILATLTIAAVLGATGVSADERTDRILLVHGNHIDGPIVHTAVAFGRDMYPDVGFVAVYTPHFVNAKPGPDVGEPISCIIGVGQDGQARAQWWWRIHADDNPQVEVAQGADRYATAFAVADAVDRCLQ